MDSEARENRVQENVAMLRTDPAWVGASEAEIRQRAEEMTDEYSARVQYAKRLLSETRKQSKGK